LLRDLILRHANSIRSTSGHEIRPEDSLMAFHSRDPLRVCFNFPHSRCWRLRTVAESDLARIRDTPQLNCGWSLAQRSRLNRWTQTNYRVRSTSASGTYMKSFSLTATNGPDFVTGNSGQNSFVPDIYETEND
jgi:hypothetical protein